MTSDNPKPKKKKAHRYQKRLVLFLDFLGFKEHVERSDREPPYLARLIAAMDIVGRIGASHKGFVKSQKVTQFSDSIVVSYKVSEPAVVFLLLNEIAMGVLDLAQRGFLVRGGVTVGKLHHSKRHVVGPAMNEAYRLESKVAKYPRVLIDPKVLRRRKCHAHAIDQVVEPEGLGHAADENQGPPARHRGGRSQDRCRPASHVGRWHRVPVRIGGYGMT